MLLPEDAQPTTVVLHREAAMRNLAEQLPSATASLVSPFFEAAAGTKVVRGCRVEGGEGHGPRKEFFMATTKAATDKWGPPVARVARGSKTAGGCIDGLAVSCRGPRMTVAKVEDAEEASAPKGLCQDVTAALQQAQRGDQVIMEVDQLGNDPLQRVVMAPFDGETICFDKPVMEAGQQDSQLVVSIAVQRAVSPLFTFHRSSGHQWFSAHASDLASRGEHGDALKVRYQVFGKLLALALANRCRIGLILPALFFYFLLAEDPEVRLEDLKGFDSELYTSLKKCLTMRDNAFAQVREVEGLAADITREEYVQAQVKSTLMPDGMVEIRSGFWSLLGNAAAALRSGISCKELQLLLCPMETRDANLVTDFRSVFKVTMEAELAECPTLVNAFWTVVNGLSVAEKRQFLLFVTGVDAPPEPMTERLIIQMPFAAFSTDEHAAMLGKLPQAHTCSNTIELPNYYESLLEAGTFAADAPSSQVAQEVTKILGERLRLAIRETAGYELDAVDADRLADESAEALLWEAENEVRLIAEAQQGEIRNKSPPSTRPTSSPRPPPQVLGASDSLIPPPPPSNPPPAASEAISPLALFRSTSERAQQRVPERSGGWARNRTEELEKRSPYDEADAVRKNLEMALQQDITMQSVDEEDKVLSHRLSVDSLLEELEVGLKDDGWSSSMLR
mmetsp:Transcript_44680/g.100646  ORF Transcript_44680/g.100646 Transcript_44680/m.100646 type:complete len:678 (+) Transcript_44680:3-2036(+)